MVRHFVGCMGDYDFDRIAHYAHRRFVEGEDTITLMEHAESEREKEEIALVALMDVEDDDVRELELVCRHAGQCKITLCRDRLRVLIAEEIHKGRPQR